jgi:hypothetical protein
MLSDSQPAQCIGISRVLLSEVLTELVWFWVLASASSDWSTGDNNVQPLLNNTILKSLAFILKENK